MGMPEQHIIVEVAKDNWSWLKWTLGIVGSIIAAVIVDIIRRKQKSKQ